MKQIQSANHRYPFFHHLLHHTKLTMKATDDMWIFVAERAHLLTFAIRECSHEDFAQECNHHSSSVASFSENSKSGCSVNIVRWLLFHCNITQLIFFPFWIWIWFSFKCSVFLTACYRQRKKPLIRTKDTLNFHSSTH